ncbi:MAG TPA: STAS domain-containing protein, partial [Beutenbergiaceae bacterium]|nr:STAS domain-containing protein [Beutenbergiaceae bacterium]
HARTEAEGLIHKVECEGVDDLVLDLKRLGFIDSTGVSALLSLAHTVRERYGRVRLRDAPERALFLLDVRGGLGMFDGRGRRSA